MHTPTKWDEIIGKSSYAGTPKQKVIAERKNRHLLEVACALMFTTYVPKHFWFKAILRREIPCFKHDIYIGFKYDNY